MIKRKTKDRILGNVYLEGMSRKRGTGEEEGPERQQKNQERAVS